MYKQVSMRTCKLGKDSQRSLHCVCVNSLNIAHLIKYSNGANRAFLKLTSHAGRLRERTAGKCMPRETMLLLMSVQSMI